MSNNIILQEIELIKQWREDTTLAIDEERRKLLSVFDSISEPVYVATMDTYEILYANKAVTDLLGAKVGDICYEALQRDGEPCEFCSNEYLQNLGDEHIWEFRNSKTQRWYRCVDRAIRWPDGRIVRLELAIDITEIKQAQEHQETWIHTLQKVIHLTTDAI